MIMHDLFQNKNCWSTAIVSWMCDDLYIRVHEYIPTIAHGGVNYDKDVPLCDHEFADHYFMMNFSWYGTFEYDHESHDIKATKERLDSISTSRDHTRTIET